MPRKNDPFKKVSQMLFDYFDGVDVPKMDDALRAVSRDPHFEIILLYYRDHEKREAIAERLNMDVKTVYRNKKRLCERLARLTK